MKLQITASRDMSKIAQKIQIALIYTLCSQSAGLALTNETYITYTSCLHTTITIFDRVG